MRITYLQRIFQKKNEVENVKFLKSQEYGVIGMTIISDIKDSSILKVTNEKNLKL